MDKSLLICKESVLSKFSNFGELLFYSYANLHMLDYALNAGLAKYDRTCFMIRSKAFKSYKEGKWNIHDLLEYNVRKIQQNDFCWYCGKLMEPNKLTKDHVFPRIKGGDNDMNNIIMVCKSCNSSKGDSDLFEWYFEVRNEWPPFNVMAHYLKNIYLFSAENGLLDKGFDELAAFVLPFNWRYIPTNYPQPEYFFSHYEGKNAKTNS